MDVQLELNKTKGFKHLELLARQVVEGFISGMHKSPFHGFSAEFAEHKIYNNGESTKHIDWKLFAKTDRLYTKRYDEETNLRCHLIIDNSASMHYPKLDHLDYQSLNKSAFTALASAALMQMLKKQRDAVGLSIYSDNYEVYRPEKGSERHYQELFHELNKMVTQSPKATPTATYKYLHQIAEKTHRRSLIFLFTDMFQTLEQDQKLFEALRHLKHNKHEVVLFHVIDKTKEIELEFEDGPKRFEDVETGEVVKLYPEHVKDNYKNTTSNYIKAIKQTCIQDQIKYVEADINDGFYAILNTFMVERQKFI